MSGTLFVVSAPSGTGKTTILKQMMAAVPGIVFSVSHTTREPRRGERQGYDYHFVEHVVFQKMINDGDFLEWAEVHGNYYGTAMSPVRAQLDSGLDVVLDIDVQGAGIIRDSSPLPAAYIFVAPPDMAELERRLRGRGTEDEESVLKRLENARREMQHCSEYDYLIVNEKLSEAVTMLSGIVFAERSRNRRTIDGKKVLPGIAA